MSSRAAQRRARKRAREDGTRQAVDGAYNAASSAPPVMLCSCARYDPDAPADSGSAASTANQIWTDAAWGSCGASGGVPQRASSTAARVSVSVASPEECQQCDDAGNEAKRSAEQSGTFAEWSIPRPGADSELYDGLSIAITQARAITGRKYRYGATLLAGEDSIPLKSGSNKKVFLRANIHAEMAALKGCVRPAGKDMMLARLAPVAPEGSDDEESGRGAAREKLLNARPCSVCEAKMIARGIRHCYFTLNDRELGVLAYNADT